MPNWTYNTLSVNPEHLPSILNEKNQVDFTILLPIPEQVDNIEEIDPINSAALYAYISNKDNIAMDAIRDPSKLSEDKRFRIHTYLTAFNDKESGIGSPFAEPDDPFEFNKIFKAYRRVIDNFDDYHQSPEMLFDRGKIMLDNYLAYGAATAYHYACRYWGTKWNASQTEIRNKTKDNVDIFFMTPWNTPYGWLQKLADSGIVFRCQYKDEDGPHGEISY